MNSSIQVVLQKLVMQHSCEAEVVNCLWQDTNFVPLHRH